MLDHLNPPQREAVLEQGHTIVLACPGSGKTRVITDKTAYLLSTMGRAAKVVCVTFTNESSREMKERITHAVGTDRVQRQVVFGTFHAIASRMLRKAGHNWSLVDPRVEQPGLIKRAIEIAGVDMPPDDAASGIDKIKSTIDYVASGSDIELVYEAYQDLLTRNHAVDFHDLLLMNIRGLREGSIPPMKATHLLVDEFQDTDLVQYEFVRLHLAAGSIGTVVGDDDQSLYSWRHAMGYSGMMRFEKEFTARRVVLDTNYRCHAEILGTAETLIRHNVERVNKRLHAHKGPGGSVVYRRYRDRADEAVAVAKAVSEDPGSWAVLCRTNRRLAEVETQLRADQIPFVLPKGASLWSREVVMHLVTLLEAVSREHRFSRGVDNALRWAGMSEQDLLKLPDVKSMLTRKVPPGLTPEGQRLMNDFLNRFAGWRSAVESDRIPLAISGVQKWLEDHTKKESAKDDLAPAAKLLKRLQGTLPQRLNTVKNPPKNEEGEGVRLLTMHGSKGLEFPNVWIIGLEDTLLPGESPSRPEERRILFVGMTRAQEDLVLSSTYEASPSPFLEEAGLDTSSPAPPGVAETACP